jgi:stage II sporulation SpoAA-like protein
MAIKLNDYEGGKLLEVEVSGKLHREDYPHFIPEFERHVQDHGKVRVLFDMRDFHGWDMGALWEDTKFNLTHFKDIERLAMVGDQKWEEWMAGFCRAFTTAKIRYFDENHKSDARDWLEEGAVAGTLEAATQEQLREVQGVRT